MHSNCTVCGVKLNTKNKVSYRPNSCRDCELERKRLYSLKRKSGSSKKSVSKKATSKKSNKKTIVKKPVKKISAKKTNTKKTNSKRPLNTKTKAQLAKEREKLRKLKEKEREKARKEKERLKALKEKEKNRLLKEKERIRKEKEKEKIRLVKEKEKLRKDKEKEKELLRKEKEQEKDRLRQEKEAEKDRKRQEKEQEKLRKKQEKEEAKRKKIEEKEKKAQEKADKEKAEKAKKKLLDMNIIVDIPDYIVSNAAPKVKKRRMGKVTKASGKDQIVDSAELSKNLLEEKREVLTFHSDDGEVLRAPSQTPWEGPNFKVVGGSYVNNTDTEDEETKGPSEEEVKAIIERIRLEHKTRKDTKSVKDEDE